MAEKKSKESESKDVEMAAEGEEKEGAKEGTEEEPETKKQGQKDKDLLTFEGKLQPMDIIGYVSVISTVRYTPIASQEGVPFLCRYS